MTRAIACLGLALLAAPAIIPTQGGFAQPARPMPAGLHATPAQGTALIFAKGGEDRKDDTSIG